MAIFFLPTKINGDLFLVPKIDVDFKSVVGLEDKEWSKLLKTNWKNDGKTTELNDIRKLYHIEKLQTHNDS